MPARRNVSRRYQTLLLLLTVTLFGWVLRSKLALYETPSASRTLAVAKLISKDDKGAATSVKPAHDGDQRSPVRIGRQAGFPPASSQLIQAFCRENGLTAALHLSIPTIYFKPPPALA